MWGFVELHMVYYAWGPNYPFLITELVIIWLGTNRAISMLKMLFCTHCIIAV